MTKSASEVLVVKTYVEFLKWVEFLTNVGFSTYGIESIGWQSLKRCSYVTIDLLFGLVY